MKQENCQLQILYPIEKKKKAFRNEGEITVLDEKKKFLTSRHILKERLKEVF